MIRSVYASLIGLAMVALPLQAHEIKVFASAQRIDEGRSKTTIYLSWGHRVPVDELIDAATLDKYDLVAPEGTKTALKSEGVSLQTNAVTLDKVGLHQVAVTRKASIYTYVFDENGDRQLKRGGRTSVNDGKIDVAFRSLQCAKAMIVVGKPSEDLLKPLGQPLEIVPLDAPAKWKSNTELKFQVLLHGKPVPTAEVVARPIGFKPDDAWSYSTHTNKKGEATLHADRAGTWVIKVSVKVPAADADRKEIDQESFTATLSLEIGS